MNDGLWAAAIAAIATLVGYLANQASQRRHRRATVYADSLATLRRWQEVPYLVLRRAASTAETRAELGVEISQASSGVAYHANLLRLESAVLADAFELLWRQLRVARTANLRNAWNQRPMRSDQQMTEYPGFVDDYSEEEYRLCLLAMRRELSPFAVFTRWDTRRRIAKQLDVRGPALPRIPIR